MKRKPIYIPEPSELGKESVKISKQVVDKIRAYKKQTGVSLTAFIEQACEEKFKRLKSK